jgi:hypothetical protein
MKGLLFIICLVLLIPVMLLLSWISDKLDDMNLYVLKLWIFIMSWILPLCYYCEPSIIMLIPYAMASATVIVTVWGIINYSTNKIKSWNLEKDNLQ